MKTKSIKELIQQDYVGVANPATEARLQQAFMARSAAYHVRQNSFSDFFGWIFSTRQLATKLAFASILLAFLAIRPNFNFSPQLPVTADSTRVDQSRVLDSALLILPGDTTGEQKF
ncbi:hypothetical protein [Mangrovibacterium lignilyticum]|uniref:hypothetical protein n=1 Tax=Mangrovibacterium lignilyticum TaxID=2668052 RepID=UPI0013D4AB87|nr:hypothetical protein [Mangrovibacterium lignilyticum]